MNDELKQWARGVRGVRLPAKAVLFVLALDADDEGIAHTRVRDLCREFSIQDRTCRRLLAELEGARLIEKIPNFDEFGGRLENSYRIGARLQEEPE